MIRTIERSLRINETVVAAELDNEMVLLNIETGLYFGLDELGTKIWSLITADTDEATIVDRVVAEYDVARGQVEADVRAFVDLLETKGLLHAEAR